MRQVFYTMKSDCNIYGSNLYTDLPLQIAPGAFGSKLFWPNGLESAFEWRQQRALRTFFAPAP